MQPIYKQFTYIIAYSVLQQMCKQINKSDILFNKLHFISKREQMITKEKTKHLHKSFNI